MSAHRALVLGAAASTLGALLGAGLSLGIDALAIEVPADAVRIILLSDRINLSVSLVHIAASIVAFTLITGVAALLPAWRASRMQPVTAIQSV